MSMLCGCCGMRERGRFADHANHDAGQQAHRFEFPGIDKSAVLEVLLTTSNGRCIVIGPGS